MSRSLASFVGEKISHVTAIEVVSGYKMRSLCECGNYTLVQGCVLKKAAAEGRGVSCGCMKKRLISVGQTEHGLTHSRTWNSWSSMLERCYSPVHKSYKDYGGRGVTVCQEWRDSFVAFLNYMGIRPDGTTLGRIKNDGVYEPGNCQWEGAKQQCRNRRSSRFIECFGKRLTLVEWSELSGIPHDTLSYRMRTWSVEKALTQPIKKQSNSRVAVNGSR